MLRFRLGTVNGLHWRFKPVLSNSKPHTFSIFCGQEKEIHVHFLSPTVNGIAMLK